MKKKILELLQNCPDFISGQELSERFGVSRTAVWKVIRQLEAEGYVIQAVRNKGYRLTAQPDLLTEETIQNQIHTEWAGQQLVVFSETDSTNDQAKKLAEEGAGQGRLVRFSMLLALALLVILRQQGKDAVAAPGNPEWAKEFL